MTHFDEVGTGFDAPIPFDGVTVGALGTFTSRVGSRAGLGRSIPFDAPVSFDAAIGFDGVDRNAWYVTKALAAAARVTARLRGTARSSSAGNILGERPLTMRTGQQKREPQRRRPSRLSPIVKLIRKS